MDPLNNSLCRGCLSSDRKMINLTASNLKDCFSQISQKTTMLYINKTIQLCFECIAILNKIKQFQEKVLISSKTFQNCEKNVQSLSSLQTNNVYNIDILEHKEIDSYEIIKIEPPAPIFDNEDDIDYTENDIEQGIDIKKENYTEGHLSVKENIQSLSSLQTNNVCNIHILEHKEIDSYELIKTEPPAPIFDNGDDIDYTENDVEQGIDIKTENYREVHLSMKEIEEERSMLLSSDEYVNAMFKCELCVMTFTNEQDYNDHDTAKHRLESKYKCPICKCAFNSSISFKYHTNRHKRRYECNVCQTRFTYKRDVIKHYNIKHCHGVETLNYNKDSTEQKLEADNDISDKEKFSCNICTKQFRWKASLRKHLEQHRIESGQKRKPYCEPCKLYFATTANLKKHVRTSSKHQIQLKLRKLNGTAEGEKDDAIKAIRSSVNSVRQTYSCPQCDKRFQWHGNLVRHLNNHRARASGELVCVPCNRSFSSVATYRQHLNISKKHVTENDFKYMCSDCGKKFADKTRLKDHIDWEHLKNYVHTCSDCQKPFKTRTSLYLHKQVVHQKDRSEHLCDTCGKHFPNQSKLRIHIRSAHSASAYKCASCGAKFAWHSCLSRHIRRLHKKTV